MTSCVTIVKWKYGIRNPREETPESLIEFLKKMNKSPEDIYLFRDSSSYFHYLNIPVFRKNLIGSMFFNGQGLLTGVKDTNKCQWSVNAFIENLEHQKDFLADTSFRFQDLDKCLVPLVNDGICREMMDPDFIVVINWGCFAGKLNQRFFDVSAMDGEKRDIRIRLVFLNIDMQKSWELTKDQKLKLK